MSGSAFAVTHHAFSSGAGRTSDGNGSHASTLKSPSYTKSVSWQHYHDRIEQTLKHCIEAKMLPADLMTRRAAIIMRGYISGLMENWLFAPQSFDLKKEARDYVAILLEMYLLCPTLRNPATNE
ncbi:hypothetical protein [Escherichia coli]|uniref:hypothetical protein n=1 Tax=Escherichia coli TaxID=562 RepID=UPI000A5E2C2C